MVSVVADTLKELLAAEEGLGNIFEELIQSGSEIGTSDIRKMI